MSVPFPYLNGIHLFIKSNYPSIVKVMFNWFSKLYTNKFHAQLIWWFHCWRGWSSRKICWRWWASRKS